MTEELLKYEHIQPGQRIRSYDFEPLPSRPDKYVEGVVESHFEDRMGVKFLLITVDFDTIQTLSSRVGRQIYVPMETTFDYDGRVEVLA